MVQKIPASGLESAGGSFKNIFINGDMRIAQRATSATTISNLTYQTIDRIGGMEFTDGTATLEQHSMSDADEATTGQKFAALWKCTGTDSSIAADQYAGVYQHVEAQNLQQLNYGTSAAKDLTLSFWVRSNTTGTYSIGLRKYASTSHYIALTYTIDSADTWEKKVIHISPTAGSTSLITGANGVINNDNAVGFYVYIYTALGSNYHTASPNTWTTSSIYGTSDQPNLMSSTSNNWYITGLQLEVGDTASDFEYLPHDISLQRCRRYYYKMGPGDSLDYFPYGVGSCATTQVSQCHVMFPVEMRTDTTMETTGTAINYTIYEGGSLHPCDAVPSKSTGHDYGTRVNFNRNSSAGLNAGNAAECLANGASGGGGDSSFLAFAAEL